MNEKTLCIYHGNCADGFSSAWCVRKALGEDNVEFHAGVYQNPPPDVTGRDVLMVISVISAPCLKACGRKPDQIIQPWQFGHGETKATCLWLKNLPLLQPTNIVDGRENRVHRMPPGPNRTRERSRTYAGIAKAMAEQWG